MKYIVYHHEMAVLLYNYIDEELLHEQEIKYPCIIRDFSDGLKLGSIPVKGILTLVSNWYILKVLDGEFLVLAMAVSAAAASVINRSRNAWLWNKNLFPKKKVQDQQGKKK